MLLIFETLFSHLSVERFDLIFLVLFGHLSSISNVHSPQAGPFLILGFHFLLSSGHRLYPCCVFSIKLEASPDLFINIQ